MQIESHPAEPVARCKVCGSAAIVAVCHHCSATLCRDHATNGARGSREFRGLDIRKKGRGEDPIHCGDCAHRLVSDVELAVLGLACLALGVLVVASSASLFLAAVVAALGLAVVVALAVVFVNQRREEGLDHCPVIPEVENERIVETYRYRAQLTAGGEWCHEAIGAEGVARADLRFGPDDVKRVGRWSARPGRRPGELEAGFVVLDLRGPAAVDDVNIADDGDRHGAERVTLDTAQLPYLLAGGRPRSAASNTASNTPGADVDAKTDPDDGRPSSVLRWAKPFDIRLPDETRPPVQVFPTLARGSDRRTLEFHLGWRSVGKPTDLIAERVVHSLEALQPTEIDVFEFRLPLAGLGGATPLDGDPLIVDEAPESGGLRTIRWEQLSIGRDQQGRRLSVRFDRPIPPDIRIEGSVAIVFDRSAAGLRGMRWFDPMGQPVSTADGGVRANGSATTTVVDVAFDLSLAPVPHEEEFVQLEKPIELSAEVLASVRPDHQTAIAVSAALTRAGFQVFQVNESTFSPSDRSAEENRVWELHGRRFENTAPLDFQVKIHGADLRRRLDASAETYQVTGVTLAGQAAYDNPSTLDRFRTHLRTVETETQAALIEVAKHSLSGRFGADPATASVPSADDVNLDLDQAWSASAPSSSSASTSESGSGSGSNGSGPTRRREYDITDHHQERRCSMCGLADHHEAYALCHHCGRLLCLSRCSIRVRRDPAFARGIDREVTMASHCEDCARDHHPVAHLRHRVATLGAAPALPADR